MNNPFLQPYHTLHDTTPFQQIRIEDYEPAVREGMRLEDEEIQQITSNPEEPTFQNTILALEHAGKTLDRVTTVLFNLLSAETCDALEEIAEKLTPALSEHANNISLNEQLFARVKAVYDKRESLQLTPEERRLLEKSYDGFVRNGANLSEEDKATFRKLSMELSSLTLKFSQNHLKETNGYELVLHTEDELAGLPESAIEAAAHTAHEKEKEGCWVITLQAPSYVPFMRYSALRGLREKMYREYMSIGNKGDEYDNKEIIREIVNIRLEIARLMGYTNYADYKLKHTMAKTPARVYKLLNELLDAYKPVARNEYKTVQRFASETEKENIAVMPWDWSYYSEKLKDIRFNVNDEMTRPYFELNHVKKGVFGLATQLYGITFKENKEIPVYHPEVEAYEVYDADGKFLSILYTDFHPRDGKQSGAWMNSIKEQYRDQDGKDSRPQIIIVMNFTRPTETKPSLLTFDEVNTLLHEFGHALHGMFAEGSYASLSGTNVYRDFVELPSQLMENWLTEKEFLDQIAIHYKTGEKIPQELVQKLIDASNFNAGYACCRQLSFGFLDMAWHTRTEPFGEDVISFEKEAWKQTVIVPEVPGTLMSSSFGHIFSGGYSAGYYGYKWAEVLDADAFSVFKETGIFNRETARSFRKNILSKGGTEDPDILYKRFRGKDAEIGALLKRNGIEPGGPSASVQSRMQV